jgi:hypothetical protein
MTIRSSAALTAGLLAALFLAGSLFPAHADDGCGSAKKTKRDAQTGTLWTPQPPAGTAQFL